MRGIVNLKLSFLITLLLCMGMLLPVNHAQSFSTPASVEYSKPSDFIVEVGYGKPKPRQKKNKGKRAAAHRKHIIEQMSRSWERESSEATKRQILESKPADRANFKFLKDGLIAHEGHSRQPGGHTIQRHVGLSNKGLKDRYAHDKSLIAKSGSKKGQRATEYISTFHSLKKAEHFVEQTLQHNGKKIEKWLNGSSYKPLRLDHIFTETTGSSLHGPSGQINNVNGVRVVLKRAPNHRNGWKLLEAMPEKGQPLAKQALPNVKKAVNTKLPHASSRAVERGVFLNKKMASEALRELSNNITKNGFPKGTILDTNPGGVLVPIGKNGYAVYKVNNNSTAKLQTVLIKR